MEHHTTTPACVLLTPTGVEADTTLRAELQRRDWACVAVDDPYLALAELCIREHGERTRDEWGLSPAPPPRLVVDAPEQSGLTRAWRDLRDAVQSYAPSAEIWIYRDRSLTLESPAMLPPESEIVPDRERSPAPTSDVTTPVEVTADEIAMLLDRPDTPPVPPMPPTESPS